MKKHMVIIGGGITGVTSAYALAQQGIQVTLIEKNRYPGMETSYANGGQLSASNAEVWTHPSTIIKGIKWMLQSDAPLLMNPAPTWHKLSWMAEFVTAMPRYKDNTIATARLAIASREHHFAWAKAEGIDFDHKPKGILHIYRDKKGFDHAGEVSQLLAQGGLPRRAVTPQEMKAIEPTLQGHYYGGYFTESDSTGDIHKYIFGLAKACERLGVKILTEHQVLVVPSVWQEPFGVVALEAMACGCVPLVSRSGGLPDAAGAAGVVFELGDSRALAQAIEELLDDTALLNRLRAASAIHLQRHTRDRVARDYLQVLADACRSSTPQSAPRAV